MSSQSRFPWRSTLFLMLTFFAIKIAYSYILLHDQLFMHFVYVEKINIFLYFGSHLLWRLMSVIVATFIVKYGPRVIGKRMEESLLFYFNICLSPFIPWSAFCFIIAIV